MVAGSAFTSSDNNDPVSGARQELRWNSPRADSGQVFDLVVCVRNQAAKLARLSEFTKVCNAFGAWTRFDPAP